ncbi:hypothetical protein D0T53_11145 [Dysgonomonas sp. 216]|uniref:hypothetical protein n=1 Tax=Dysgonomonas sp. 216 TaxID=2302934 RepID=UPI0013D37ADC|nr:hypothetical protein [Dysgonomonas sp. 216]NDW19460.1 hypothetical protein [Dysgonomonas sp. 216]
MGNKKMLVILGLMSMLSCCKKYNIDRINTFVGSDIGNKINFIKKYEQWDDFQGDGCSFLIFSIKDEYKKDITENLENRKWNSYEASLDYPLFKSEISFKKNEKEIIEYLKNGKGFYKREVDCKEVNTIIVDTVNNKLFYYYIFL